MNCFIESCEKPIDSHGYCAQHAARFRRYGDPLFSPRQSALERFEAKYIPEPNTGCWLWTASLNADGYSQFWFDGKMSSGHLFSYRHFVGPIPLGFQPDHKCRVRSCVNYHHLEAVTQAENILRGFGACANNARKTSCPKGHPYTLENTLLKSQGGKECRTCRNAYRKRWRARRELLGLPRL